MKHNLFAVLALSAVAAAAVPATALANTSAKTQVVNVVEVTYSDTSGNNKFTAAASAMVTVNLVKSPLNATMAPINGIVDGLKCPDYLTAVSGGTISALYALTATANGADAYDFTMGPSGDTTSTANKITRTFSTLNYDGTLKTAFASSREMGSAIPVGVSTDDTLLFPGGTLQGFEQNDIVLVQIGEGSSKVMQPFKVAAVSVGKAATASTAEEKGSLTLSAYGNTPYNLNGVSISLGGGNVTPAFTTATTAPTLGVPVGEMVLVQVDITASASTLQSDGVVDYDLRTTDGKTVISCTAGAFKTTALSIKKEVRNVTVNGPWGTTATGNPLQVLEYRITVKNVGGQAAKVSIKDAVPPYTTLVTNGNNFATITESNEAGQTGNIVTITTAADSETQPNSIINTGFGDVALTEPNRPMNFYLGDYSSQTAGGTVPSCSNAHASTKGACEAGIGTWLDTYTILYQVKID
ncbi:MAG: hypothetical protein FPO08_10910 [Geobacter sp.]|nr:MAG: hypothetical protein FPO08_10910 [Geobacter sp.]